MLLKMLAVTPEDRFDSGVGVAAAYDRLAETVLPRVGDGGRRGTNPLTRPA